MQLIASGSFDIRKAKKMRKRPIFTHFRARYIQMQVNVYPVVFHFASSASAEWITGLTPCFSPKKVAEFCWTLDFGLVINHCYNRRITIEPNSSLNVQTPVYPYTRHPPSNRLSIFSSFSSSYRH